MILVLGSMFLDYILAHYLPFIGYYCSWFYPSFFLISSIIFYFLSPNSKKYLWQITGLFIISSLLFPSHLFLRLLSFYVVYILLDYFRDHFRMSFPFYLSSIILSIIVYYLVYYLILLLFNYPGLSFSLFGYQLVHRILSNLGYAIFLYFILGIKCKAR